MKYVYKLGLLILLSVFTSKAIFAISKQELKAAKEKHRKISEHYKENYGSVKVYDNGGSNLYIETRDLILKPIIYNNDVVSAIEDVYSDKETFNEYGFGLYYSPKLLRSLIKSQSNKWASGNRISGFLIYKGSSPYKIKGIIFLQEQDSGKQVELSGLMYKDMQNPIFGIYSYQVVNSIVRGWLERECEVGTKISIYKNPKRIDKIKFRLEDPDQSEVINRDGKQETLSYIVGRSIIE